MVNGSNRFCQNPFLNTEAEFAAGGLLSTSLKISLFVLKHGIVAFRMKTFSPTFAEADPNGEENQGRPPCTDSIGPIWFNSG